MNIVFRVYTGVESQTHADTEIHVHIHTNAYTYILLYEQRNEKRCFLFSKVFFFIRIWNLTSETYKKLIFVIL